MTAYYPVYLNISHKRCVVVGGGGVAYRKASSLREAGAEVTVVAKKFSKEFEEDGGFILMEKPYDDSCLEGAFLVIAATNDKNTNSKVFEDAERLGILANVVDQPALCNFIVPSSINRGPLCISISTGGASPALARNIRETIEKVIGPEYGVLVELLSKIRPVVQASIKDETERKMILERLAEKNILYIIKTQGREKAEAEMMRIVALTTRRPA